MDVFVVRVLLTLQLVGWSASQAPGDADTFCTVDLKSEHPVIPNNVRVLMDSADYLNLIDDNTSPDPVWQTVDVDGVPDSRVRVNWEQTITFGCTHQVEMCAYEVPNQDNWLITQHINRTLSSGFKLQQVSVTVEFSFSCTGSECSTSFPVYKYDTSVINPAAARTVSNYGSIPMIKVVPTEQSGEKRQNATFEIDFEAYDQETGFYLAIRDENSCIAIFRILVFYYVCPEEAQDRVQFQEVLAPPTGDLPITSTGECVPRASPESESGEVRVTCSAGGAWLVILGCECDPGYHSDGSGRLCQGCPAGQFSDGEQCVNCPSNTITTVANVSECQCLSGYYRAISEGPEVECTQSPSPPLNLVVVGGTLTGTSVSLSWDPPPLGEDGADGGRPSDPIRYGLHYQRDGEDIVTLGIVNATNGTIEGLTPFTHYTVYVSSENAVSGMDPNITGRSDSVQIVTNIGDNAAGATAVAVIVAPIVLGVAVIVIISIAILLVYIKWKSTHHYVDCHSTFQLAPSHQSISDMNTQASAEDCVDPYYWNIIDAEPQQSVWLPTQRNIAHTPGSEIDAGML